MSSQAPQEPIENGYDPLLLQALARLNEIGASINRLTGSDAAGFEAILRLIVESAIKVTPHASAVLYTYDSERRAFDPVSRVSAGERGDESAADLAEIAQDAPRPLGLGVRAVAELRPVLSYDEPDLDIHPAKLAAGARVMACFPLLVGDRPLGVLYVYLQEERRFSQLELLLLGNFVNQAAIAIYRTGQVAEIQRDLARKDDELSRLRRAGLLISSRTRLDETLEVILQMALEVTSARYGILRLVDPGGQNLVTRAMVGERLGRPAVEALPLNATSIMGWVAKTRQPLCIADVHLPPWARIYYPLDHSLEMRSELAVPLIGAGGRMIGVLNLESPAVGAFSEADSHLLQSLATQAVIAIQEVRLLDALQEMAERLLVQPSQEVLEHLVTLACELLGGSASAIWLLNDDVLILAAASAGHVRGDRLALHDSLTGQAILTRDCIICDDVRAEPRFGWPRLAQAQGWTRALIVPLLSAADREPVGAFSVYGTASDEGRFTASDWDKKVLGILAHYAALAVRNAESQAALQAAQEQRATAETLAAVGDIAANLLHRLNNKVGTIPVRVEGIEDKCAPALAADPYLAANLHEIGQSARTAMESVRQSLAHLQAMPLAPVSVAQCVADALASSHLPPGVQVEVAGLADLPPVHAHARGLTFVFDNLLENAADAMEEQGKIVIRGALRRGWVEVVVSDSGPGIPPELRGRIFDLSFSGPRRSRPDKLGFGLWWVRTLMTRLGGTIGVESDGQHGTSFRLRLPAV